MSSPVCCVLGHVDVGKTKLLDKLRESDIQKKEIGGITQQIGSTYFGRDALKNLVGNLNVTIDIPGLLMIDTPGHDCFSQMRLIGVHICHLAIIIIDIVKGLEKQTAQCIEILKKNNTPFVIVLNKLDRVYGWKNSKKVSLKKAFDVQDKSVMRLIKDYSSKIICQLAGLEINAMLYYDNKNINEFISMVPVSAQTGEGIADLIILISKLTFKKLNKTIDEANSLYKHTHGYLMDVRRDDRLGTIYQVILMNNKVARGDKITIEGIDNLIETSIKELYIPGDESEFKGKTYLVPVNDVLGTKGIACKFEHDIEDLVNPGGLIIQCNDNQNAKSIISQKTNIISRTDFVFDKYGVTVNVPSKSMGDAIIRLLSSDKIKIKNVHVGKLTKTCIIKAANSEKSFDATQCIYNKRYSVILNYDMNSEATIDKEISELASSSDVTILSNSIIYRLIEEYKNYCVILNNDIKLKHPNIIKPIKCKIMPQYIFLKKNPLMFGVKIETGTIKKNLIIMASRDNKNLILGKIISIQKNSKPVDEADNGSEVCIKIESENNSYEYGHDFDHSWSLHNYNTDDEKYIAANFHDVFV